MGPLSNITSILRAPAPSCQAEIIEYICISEIAINNDVLLDNGARGESLFCPHARPRPVCVVLIHTNLQFFLSLFCEIIKEIKQLQLSRDLQHWPDLAEWSGCS